MCVIIHPLFTINKERDMAAVASATSTVPSLAKAVQELATNTSTTPERYILKESTGGKASELPYLDIPILDLSLLNSSSPEAEEELKRLRLAFSSCGYIQVSIVSYW